MIAGRGTAPPAERQLTFHSSPTTGTTGNTPQSGGVPSGGGQRRTHPQRTARNEHDLRSKDT
jgi:hypothetical protein